MKAQQFLKQLSSLRLWIFLLVWGRFRTTEGIENLQVGSDFRERALANTYGVLIADGPLKGLSARAIFVVNKAGKVVYKEICPEITEEPNYEAALCALKDTAAPAHKCGCGSKYSA